MLGVTFRALGYRNFRLFFIGQGISLVGTWVQQIAMGWLVYRLTHSAFILGIVAFASQIPTFLLGPLAGVASDRLNRHRLIITTQTLAMVQAFIMTGLMLTGAIRVWHIIALGTALGCINAMDTPARQAFIIDMVEKKETLGNAIALNSMMFNLARLIGPSIAGIIISLTGETWCFFLNGISFLAVILCLLAMKIRRRELPAKRQHILKDLKEGFDYAFGFAPIKFILFLISVLSLTGMSYVVLMPVYAKDILGGGPRTFGFLMASVGIGAVIGTVYLASRKHVLRLGPLIPFSSFLFGAGLFAFAFSRNLTASLVILGIIGFGFMVQMASCNTVIQTIVDDDKRGRVMSLYTMAFLGMAPVGSLLAGMIASRWGAANAVAMGGIFSIAVAAVFASQLENLRKIVNPIYENIHKGGAHEKRDQ